MSNLLSRLLVAVVAVPILLFVIYQDSPLWVWGLVFAGGAVSMYEFFAMTLPDKNDRMASLVMGVAVTASFYWLGDQRGGYLLSMALAIVPPFFYYTFRFGDMETAAQRAAFTVVGIFYAGVLLSFVALLKRDFGAMAGPRVSGHFIVLLLSAGWLSDTGGYFAGKALGKRKLYPAVSPNKTWAGSIGGALCAIGGGVFFKLVLLEDVPWLDIIVLSGVGAVLGQIGDLAESLLKRSVGVKDSGSILPGHGGILDRIDAVIVIAPFFYLYLTFRL